MKFELLVLGANSATPLPDRFPSCFVLNHDNHLFIIDCGEGAQIKMSQYKVKRSRVNHIFISHMHGDHIFGLPGLINSFNLNGRQNPLTIFGPFGLKNYIHNTLASTQARLTFELKIVELDIEEAEIILALKHLSICAFPLKHRIPTYGYRFEEVNLEKNIEVGVIEKYNLTIEEIKSIKNGHDLIRDNGEILSNDLLTKPDRLKRAFTYCSDTIYDEGIIPYCQNTSTLYHEATYLQELEDLAEKRFHSTAQQAAQIASQSNAAQLIIGHYSSRYKELNPLLQEAKEVFDNTQLAIEGRSYSI